MLIGTETIREYLVFALDVVRRRWMLLLFPVLIAGIAGVTAVKLAPKKYTTNSLLLLQGANRTTPGGGPVQQLNAFEQVRALEAWLKSDQILSELLPQLSGYKPPSSPAELLIQTRILAASLSLELVGNSVLQISLQGGNPKGLGRNLEIVIARLMEGLTGPEQNVLSAPQFMLMRRSEDVDLSRQALTQAIKAGQFESPREIEALLKQLWTLNRSPPNGSGSDEESNETAARLRSDISSDPATVRHLEKLYADYQTALYRENQLKQQGSPKRGNYVSIFDSPDNLLVIGRPKDPIFGESVAKKPAIGGILLSFFLAGGLVILVELLEGRVRMRKDFEGVTGLPVVARLGKLPESKPA